MEKAPTAIAMNSASSKTDAAMNMADDLSTTERPGTTSAAVSDAIVKGLVSNASLAYRAVVDDAFNVSDPYRSASGRRKGLGQYKALGYIPTGDGVGDEVSATLNYALADRSMSLAARFRGDNATAATLEARSRKAWRALFDPSFKGGFFRPRDASGAWQQPFDELAWEGAGGEYTEASAWQYRFFVPHEPEALQARERTDPPHQGVRQHHVRERQGPARAPF